MSGKPRKPKPAPDGKPFPLPRVLVDTSEQLCWGFGHVPAAWAENAPVHYGVPDPESPVLESNLGGAPWHSRRANLMTGDYQLEHPENGEPLGSMIEHPSRGSVWCGAIVIERKQADLGGSLTKTRVQLEAECERMRNDFAWSAIITTRTFDKITKGDMQFCEGREKSMLGTLMAFQFDHGVHIVPTANRWQAEYMAAWYLQRAWQRWLTEHPESLQCERARGG